MEFKCWQADTDKKLAPQSNYIRDEMHPIVPSPHPTPKLCSFGPISSFNLEAFKLNF